MKYKIKLFICLFCLISSISMHAQGKTTENAIKSEVSIPSFIYGIWEKNPAIAEAQARVLSAQANLKAESRWKYNPEIEGNIESVSGEEKTKQISFSQTIDWNGKFHSAGKTAFFKLQEAEAIRDRLRQKITLDILSSLSELIATKEILNLAIKRTSAMERFSDLASRRYKAGEIDKGEYNLAQLALSEALIIQSEIETSLAKTKQRLNSSIGFPIENNAPLPKLPENLPVITEIKDEDQILMHLPQLRAMKGREKAAYTIINQAQKRRLPDPTIGITGGKEAGSNMVGFSVSFPLCVFNSYKNEVEVAKQNFIAEAKAQQNTFHNAKEELRAAHRGYQLSRKAWIHWKNKGSHALLEQIDILDRKFKVGDLSATDYLVQIEQALDTQKTAQNLYKKVWLSWFRWLDASGMVEIWLQDLNKNSGKNKQ